MMTGRTGRRLTALVLLVGLLAPSPVLAGPFIGEWSCWWRPAPDCPRGEYSHLHYWAPTVYKVRACVHPSMLDQYPPGPYPPVPLTYEFRKYCCPAGPGAPTTPYADPTGYYGRQVTGPR
jgi:hypothetical protein